MWWDIGVNDCLSIVIIRREKYMDLSFYFTSTARYTLFIVLFHNSSIDLIMSFGTSFFYLSVGFVIYLFQ